MESVMHPSSGQKRCTEILLIWTVGAALIHIISHNLKHTKGTRGQKGYYVTGSRILACKKVFAFLDNVYLKKVSKKKFYSLTIVFFGTSNFFKNVLHAFSQ